MATSKILALPSQKKKIKIPRNLALLINRGTHYIRGIDGIMTCCPYEDCQQSAAVLELVQKGEPWITKHCACCGGEVEIHTLPAGDG